MWKENQSDSYLKYIGQIATFLDISPTYLLRGEAGFTDTLHEEKGTCELMQIYQRLNSEQKKQLIDIARSIEKWEMKTN